MSNTALAAAAVLNVIIAAGYLRAYNYGMALAFLCYAGACTGFIWANVTGDVNA